MPVLPPVARSLWADWCTSAFTPLNVSTGTAGALGRRPVSHHAARERTSGGYKTYRLPHLDPFLLRLSGSYNEKVANAFFFGGVFACRQNATEH